MIAAHVDRLGLAEGGRQPEVSVGLALEDRVEQFFRLRRTGLVQQRVGEKQPRVVLERPAGGHRLPRVVRGSRVVAGRQRGGRFRERAVPAPRRARPREARTSSRRCSAAAPRARSAAAARSLATARPAACRPPAPVCRPVGAWEPAAEPGNWLPGAENCQLETGSWLLETVSGSRHLEQRYEDRAVDEESNLPHRVHQVPSSDGSPSASVCTSSCWKYLVACADGRGDAFLVESQRAIDLTAQALPDVALLASGASPRLRCTA